MGRTELAEETSVPADMEPNSNRIFWLGSFGLFGFRFLWFVSWLIIPTPSKEEHRVTKGDVPFSGPRLGG